MPDHDDSTPANAFHPDYLRQLDEHDDPVTADEAVTGGFWRVMPLDDDRFGLFRVWEHPEDGDEPFATLNELTEALNLADGLARSPASIASFLEAAGSAALELAGKILVRRS